MVTSSIFIMRHTISACLEAVEQRFGSVARSKTILKHRGSRIFFLKKHSDEYDQTINPGDLKMMIRHLKAA